MPDQPPLDLATANNWFGFGPGMTQAQVREKLQQLGIEEDLYSDDNFAADIEGQHLEFWFEADGSQRLRQIATDGEVVWNGKPLLDTRLDEALRAIEPANGTPMWEANDATDEPFAPAGRVPVSPVTDEKLLEEGTVWLPDRGLGLVIWQGEVVNIAWRESRDLPTRFAGPVTEAQRQLSKRPDLDEYLRERSSAITAAATPKDPLAPLHALLVCVCIGLLVFIANKGFQEMKRWNTAPTLTGKFLSMELVPRKKHFDLGPEALRKHMADDPTRHREMYHIEYLDPSRRRQETALEGAEFYVPPREPGEEVQIAYVDDDPPRVKGLSRARDAAFIEYMPWAMAVGVFYVVGQFTLGLVPRIRRLVMGIFAARVTTRDADRPELR